MKLVAFTIVLDGEPFIERHLPILQATFLRYQWIVVEGASGNTADTAWCQKQSARLSEDGTHEYINSIADTRVMHIYKKKWANKTEMCNAALAEIKEPCVLMQIDSDEIWTPKQLERIVELFTGDDSLSAITFPCRFFVGPKLITQGHSCYGDNDYEWQRAWRFQPGQEFLSHEPPVLKAVSGDYGKRMGKRDALELDLVFDHFAYATEEQVRYKEKFYGYPGLLNAWLALQAHDKFPVELSRFFAHVKGNSPKVIRV